MKCKQFTMVNPQQIVNHGLKGCNSTRTVTSFAKKYGVPCVWYSPNRNQKTLLVDWNQFYTMWNYYQTSTGPFASKPPKNWNSTPSRSSSKPKKTRYYGKKTSKPKPKTWSYKTTGRPTSRRKAA